MSTEYNDSQTGFSRTESPSSTYFKPSEAPPGKRRKFEYLWRINEGWKSRTQADNEIQWKKTRIGLVRGIASQLDFNTTQRVRAVNIFQQIDVTDSSDGQQSPLEAYCLAVCAFVANEDAQPERPESSLYLPSKSDVDNPTRFVQVQNNLGLSDAEVSSAMNTLRGEFEVYEDA